jgi:hypothetical protein
MKMLLKAGQADKELVARVSSPHLSIIYEIERISTNIKNEEYTKDEKAEIKKLLQSALDRLND